jgi:hypothetical protein
MIQDDGNLKELCLTWQRQMQQGALYSKAAPAAERVQYSACPDTGGFAVGGWRLAVGGWRSLAFSIVCIYLMMERVLSTAHQSQCFIQPTPTKPPGELRPAPTASFLNEVYESVHPPPHTAAAGARGVSKQGCASRSGALFALHTGGNCMLMASWITQTSGHLLI